LKHIDLSHSQLSTQFGEASETNRKLVVSRDELSTKYSTLEETYDSEKLKWEEELARLRAEKAKLAESSDSVVTALNEQWDAIQASRDQLREEFRKAKEELGKQKEELESEQKKLLSKLDRATKTKEGLEEILKNSSESHQQTIEILRKHTLQHISDTNIWVPILESERNYSHRVVAIPKDLAEKAFQDQLLGLTKVVIAENDSFHKLLKERETEEAEVLSVNMGKLKKRVKKGAEAEAAASKEGGSSPRRPDRPAGDSPPEGDKGKNPKPEKAANKESAASPRARPGKEAPHHSKKSDKK